MVCSDPPDGRARWTVRLVAQEACETQTGSQSRSRNHPDSAAPPRPQAVAEKNVVRGGTR
jgi:hypothetical protein